MKACVFVGPTLRPQDLPPGGDIAFLPPAAQGDVYRLAQTRPVAIGIVDGYFEGEKPWDLSFHERVWGPELEALSKEFGKKADVLIFGRRTYEGMAAYWKAVAVYTGHLARALRHTAGDEVAQQGRQQGGTTV